MKFKKFIKKYILYFAWVQALLAMIGSLYFSEIMKLPPCVLCWYQRIAMYPLVFIIPIGILTKDKKIHNYILPLGIAGLLVAIYHNLLYYKILPESVAPCTSGISCTTKYIELLGFITIPFLSLLSFVAVILCAFIFKKLNQKN